MIQFNSRPGCSEIVQLWIQAGVRNPKQFSAFQTGLYLVYVALHVVAALDRGHIVLRLCQQPDAGNKRGVRIADQRLAPGDDGETVGNQIPPYRRVSGYFDIFTMHYEFFSAQVRNDIFPIGLDEAVLNPQILRKKCYQLHIQPVSAAGDKTGVRGAEVAQYTGLPDLLEVSSGYRHGNLQWQQQGDEQSGG